MALEPLNELTFAGWLTAFTASRAERLQARGDPVLICSAEIEERQVDADGRVRRCDVRFNSASGRKLASGELKRPEVPEGRDPRNEKLRSDARRKALARGLPYYFTCNMGSLVLYEVAAGPNEDDREVQDFVLAPIERSSQAIAYRDHIAERWAEFLDELETKLVAVGRTRPTVTTQDVISIRDAIYAVANEAIARVVRRVSVDPDLAEELRQEAARSFNFATPLQSTFLDRFREDLLQMLRFGIFVVTQKLILYRVLEEAGPRRREKFSLDALEVPQNSTDPRSIETVLENAFSLAIRRSKDYETAFLPKPLVELVFSEPKDPQEVVDCRVGEVWHQLLSTVKNVSWLSISQNIVGLLYEVIVEERFRHQLGQFYTPEDVVDVLAAFSIRSPGELVLDPAAGGGSFLRSAYFRKRALGETHEDALATIWGCEITSFAAELSTVTLTSSDTREAAAYPRVILRDFFDLRPGFETDLEIPGILGKVRIPARFDAVIGNPPYISYRRQTNQNKILNALASAHDEIRLPKFSGKTDAYVWSPSTKFRRACELRGAISNALLLWRMDLNFIRRSNASI